MKKLLSVVSTFVVDIFVDNEERVQKVCAGGPAHFFRRMFQNDPAVELITGQPLAVKIKVVPGQGEYGQALDWNVYQRVPRISAPNLLVSTLLEEWDLYPLVDYPGRIFLDVQGLVRDSAGFGQKKLWTPPAALWPKLFCVKATEQELRFLPEEFVEDQKQNRCLVVTYGSRGSQISWGGRCADFPPKVVVRSLDTVGAGDTYFAVLVSEFIKIEGWYPAGVIATQAATQFLMEKEQAHA